MSKRTLGTYEPVTHGRLYYGGEPLVFHCNFYNYWLQKTLLLDPDLGMETVMHDAAVSVIYPMLKTAAEQAGVDGPDGIRAVAESTFAQLGFGLMDLSGVTTDGGEVTCTISHYGKCLRQACGVDFARPQSIWDAGFAAAAVAMMHGQPMGAFSGAIESCQSMGAPVGRIRISKQAGPPLFEASPMIAASTTEVPPPNSDTNVDEAAILAALGGLDFSGNEEGLVPRFGVMLSHHFASFYNRISFEFLRKMEETGLLEAGEMLLTDTGYRCAFHTFGGIMTSAEWDAVIKPQCKTSDDWVHGMVATINALCWGTWRVVELTPDSLRVRIYDDYESVGYRSMYGIAERPISHLAAAAVAGILNLVRVGEIHTKPDLSLAYFAHCFEQEGLFESHHIKSMAMGDAYTEILAKR